MKITNKKLLYIPVIILVLAIGGLLLNNYLKKRESSQAVMKYEELVTTADAYYQTKEYANALRSYTKASDNLPYRSAAYEGIVRVLLDKRLYSKVDEVLSSVEKKLGEQELSFLYETAGGRYYEMGLWEESLEYYKKTENDLRIGQIYAKLGEYSNASKALEGLKDNEALIVRSLIYAVEVDLAQMSSVIADSDCTREDKTPSCNSVNELKNLLDTAADHKKDELYIRTLFSKYAFNQGYALLAGDIIESALTEEIEYWEAYYMYGISMLAQERGSDAQENINSAITLGCDLSECYLSLARAYRLESNQVKAGENYERAILFAVEDDKGVLLDEYIEWLISQGLHVKAQQYLDDYPTSGDITKLDILLKRLAIHIDLEDWAGAKELLDEHGKLPTDLDNGMVKQYYIQKAHILLSIAEDEGYMTEMQADIRNTLEKLEKIDQSDPWYNLHMGRYHLLTGEREEGRSYIERAIDADITGEVTNIARKFNI